MAEEVAVQVQVVGAILQVITLHLMVEVMAAITAALITPILGSMATPMGTIIHTHIMEMDRLKQPVFQKMLSVLQIKQSSNVILQSS